MASDEEAEANLPDASVQDPVSVGILFCNALDDYQNYQTALRYLVTPESLQDWGDFSEVAKHLQSIEDRGTGSVANEAVGDPDVRYVKIMRGVSQNYQVLDAQPINLASIITVVWRKEYDRWMVHGMGPDYFLPEEVPH